LLLQDLV